MKNKERKIAKEIGYAILEFYNIDYNKALTTTQEIGIKTIKERLFSIEITMSRPGLFIGARGELINHIQKHINNTLNTRKKIIIKESNIDIDLTEFTYAGNSLADFM